MYAVIETGGKQYKVKAGSVIQIEKLVAEDDSPVNFDKVLAVWDDKGIQLGKPYLEGAVVKGTLLNQIKADKILVFKFKPKTGYKRTQGHRQKLSVVKIDAVTV
jgi:large subunit ribosomal protein L21